MTEHAVPFHQIPAESGPHPGIELPAATRVYAIGDIHGRLDLLDRLHAEIRADMTEFPTGRVFVVYLGDYVDRGPHAAGVIDALLGDPAPGADYIHLMGNHERFMLDFMATGAGGDIWLMNGGRETLHSFGIHAPASVLPRDHGSFAADLRQAMPARMRAFLASLPPCHRLGSLFFAHAGINPRRSLEAQEPADLLWIREPFLRSQGIEGTVVVHGHTPAPQPEVTPWRVNVDTGAWYTGHLTAARLENGRIGFLST